MKRDKALFSSIPAEDDWVQTLGTSMARLKEGRTQQRSIFVRICSSYGPEVLNFVVEKCNQFFINQHRKQELKRRREEAGEDEVVTLDASDSVAARVAHLCVEMDSKEIMSVIFAADGTRQALDNKNLRPGELWEKLASDYYNNSDFPLECFDASRQRLWCEI